MTLIQVRSNLITFITICIILLASAAVIAYGRGYRVDLAKTTLKPTGLLSVTSDPVAAQVYLNDKLKTATNNSISIEPGWYDIKISKEGYLPWGKRLQIQGEVVSRADAYLFPANPSLSPLTTSGVGQPALSPDGTKIAFIAKAGIWVLELTDRPLGRNRDPQQITSGEVFTKLKNVSLSWSPDSTQILTQQDSLARLYQANRLDSYQDVSLSLKSLLAGWQTEHVNREKQQLSAFRQPVIDLATSSAKIIAFSPDETKIFYEATAAASLPPTINPPLIGTNSTPQEREVKPGKLYIYDSKEDRNYFVLDKKELPPSTTRPISLPVQWLPTSRHLLITLPGKIDVMEFDRTNWVTIYSGPFTDGFVAPWSNGSRIVILTNLNPTTGSLPNLYTVNLR